MSIHAAVIFHTIRLSTKLINAQDSLSKIIFITVVFNVLH